MFLISFSVTIYFLGFLAVLLSPRNRQFLYGWIATASAGFSFIVLIYFWLTSVIPQELIFYRADLSGIAANFGFIADNLSLFGASLVSLVSFLVFLYAQDYMSEDESRQRFFGEILLFAGSMTGILLSSSLLQMFVFWELVGLSSYLLIGFWFYKPEVARAAQKVFTLIMLGDVLLFAGVVLFGYELGTWDFNAMRSLQSLSGVGVLSALLILGGAFVKSAQVPFFFWLPWAMEGPTPVSALLHSATMVKAGVFLVLRLFPLIVLAGLLPLVTTAALFTMIIAGLSAIAETDVKRVLAYSTVSQLGFMFLAIGLGNPNAGIFHLASDAFYKALLFLGAGVFIHLAGSRDLFSLKSFNFRNNLPFLIPAAIGVLGISGFPPFGGFFSKDSILETALEHGSSVFYLAVFAALLTNIYIMRWFFLILGAIFNGERSRTIYPEQSRGIDQFDVALSAMSALSPRESATSEASIFGWKTKFATGVLAAGVVFFGFTVTRFFPEYFYQHEPETNYSMIVLTLALFAAGFTVNFLSYIKRIPIPDFFVSLFLGKPYLIAKEAFCFAFSAEYVAYFGLKIARVLAIIDKIIIDGLILVIASAGKSVADAARFVDTRIIDPVLNGSVAAFVAFCFGARRFDWGVIDGLVSDLAWFFQALAEFSRPLINGLLRRYLIAFTLGTIVLIVSLNVVF